jgi:hypothetical protein
MLVKYRLCPVCYRAVPAALDEKFCPNDGTKMLEVCQKCKTPITSPYARYCVKCGADFGQKPKLNAQVK